MLDIKFIEKNAEIVKQAAKNKNADSKAVDEALQLNEERKKLLTRIESLRSEKNKLDKDRADEGRKIKEELKGLEPKLKEIDDALFYALRKIPNIPHESVPVGKDETENKVIRKWGEPKKFDFTPKDHIALGEALGVIDIETAGKVSGARFNYLKGDLAVMEIAIVQYVFSLLTNQEIVEKIARRISPMHPITPFVPVIPPVMIKPDIYIKMARLDPGQEEERFHLPKDNLYLIGSAEHTLGPMHLDEIIEENKLPLRYVGFSSCFRREAGSYGKDVRGILRVHQFDKIEMESFTASEIALNEQDFFVAIQEYMFQEFQLPYRVVMICTGDMGGPDVRQIDMEVWMPGQNKYRETHTADYMGDYQSRRLNTRVRRANGTVELIHMNDATAFAIGRLLIAIIENYQQKDGSIKIPEVLQKYIGEEIIRPVAK